MVENPHNLLPCLHLGLNGSLGDQVRSGQPEHIVYFKSVKLTTCVQIVLLNT